MRRRSRTSRPRQRRRLSRTRRRRVRKSRIPRVSQLRTVYTYRAMIPDINIAQSNAVGTFSQAAITLTLANFDIAGELVALYRQYRLASCTVHWRPRNNMFLPVNPITAHNYAELYVQKDYVDPAAWTASLFRETNGVVRLRAWESKRFTFIPTASFALYDATSGTFADATYKKRPWITTANANCEHLGLRWGLDSVATAGDPQAAWLGVVTCTIQCKNPW